MGSMELEAQIAALAARVEQLERQVTALGASVAPPPSHQPELGPPQPPPPPEGSVPATAPPPVAPEPPKPPLVTTEAALKWAGILLVVLAAVFFVGTAISRGWIGPELQLTGATAGGLILIAAGFQLQERNRPWAVALATGGALVVSICAAAANAGLDLIGEYPALALLAVVTVGLGAVAHRLAAPSVAAAAGLAAAILPLWIVEDADLPVVVVGGWMVALVLAASGFGWLRGWVPARLPTVVVAALVLLGLLVEGDVLTGTDRILAVVAVAMTAAAAWAGPIGDDRLGPPGPGEVSHGEAGIEEADAGRAWIGLDHRAVLSVPIWSWGSITVATDLDTSGAVALLGFTMTAGFIALVALGWAALPRSVAAAHLLGSGILLAVSMAVLTDGPGLLVGLAAQAAATAVLGWWLRDRWLLGLAIALGLIAVGWAAVSTLDGLFDPLPTGQILANLFVVSLLAGAAVIHRRRIDDELSVLATVVAWVGLLGWIASAFGHRAQGQVIVSLLWSALAAAALVFGVRADDRGVRTIGIATLGVVLVKLLTVDLAEVDTLWRVGLFLVIGTGLLRLGYVLPRLSSAPDPPSAPDEPPPG